MYHFSPAADLDELLRLAGAGLLAAASPLPRPWEVPRGPSVGLSYDPQATPAYRLVLWDDDQRRIELEVTPELLVRLRELGFSGLIERTERRP